MFPTREPTDTLIDSRPYAAVCQDRAGAYYYVGGLIIRFKPRTTP